MVTVQVARGRGKKRMEDYKNKIIEIKNKEKEGCVGCEEEQKKVYLEMEERISKRDSETGREELRDK